MKLKRHTLCFQHERFLRTSAGNLTSNGQDTYTYYNSGRLKDVTRASTIIYGLRYNGLGELVHRTNGNLYYLYDQQGHLLGEYNSNAILSCLINEKSAKQSLVLQMQNNFKY